jgi:hypothetical protein
MPSEGSGSGAAAPDDEPRPDREEGESGGEGPASGAARAPRGPAGIVLRAGKAGQQIVRTGGRRWSDEAEEIFLDALALTGNASFAAEMAGFSVNAVYSRRRRDPGFAARWLHARQQCVARLDLLLIRSAEAALEGRQPDAEAPLPPVSVAEAIAIVKMYGERAGGERRHRDWRARPRELEEVRASILRKLEAIERASRGGAPLPANDDPANDDGDEAAA